MGFYITSYKWACAKGRVSLDKERRKLCKSGKSPHDIILAVGRFMYLWTAENIPLVFPPKTDAARCYTKQCKIHRK